MPFPLLITVEERGAGSQGKVVHYITKVKGLKQAVHVVKGTGAVDMRGSRGVLEDTRGALLL